jgi:ParB family chromosome partitioning protein
MNWEFDNLALLRHSLSMAKTGLGRGLGALLGGSSPSTAPSHKKETAAVTSEAPKAQPDVRDAVQRVALDKIAPSALQPRKFFETESLTQLADSIREQGILQPLVVRAAGSNFEIIAGERRWRAARMAGLKEVPIIVRNIDDTTMLEWMLIENLQRENLNAIEEALGYSQLIEQFSLRQEDVAQKVGKSRTVVANALRLLKLPSDLQSWIKEEKISVGHAKVILGLPKPEDQLKVAYRVIHEGLNVRQTELLVAKIAKAPEPTDQPVDSIPKAAEVRDPHLMDIEDKLRQKFGTKIHLRYAKGKGSIELHFFSDDELERLLTYFSVNLD